ncbi:DUF2293 domain-containing protein [Bartonella sp. TP]|uniref:DUF2293 domain-containing protein n=1 Tax=Bartonella sp. TP TaxID=3057550 RepID=UPI0025B1F2C9|nr:DUF2293 domain-containing protein [Bartonella sp. TP]MDN5249353.1 DUF2293 domain-containing protein [Alphaproteobacteria bacterium]WJW79751.1 DUF2293 domain-containing protein [Bartonella sp. TP]
MNKKRKSALNNELRKLFPSIPYYDAIRIAAKAAEPHLQALPPSITIWLSAIAYIRHEYTDYNILLKEGMDLETARFFTKEQINKQLQLWDSSRLLPS